MPHQPGAGNIQVIGAGFGRSGTTSLREALHLLGYLPCYHMMVVLSRYSHLKFWIRAKPGEPVDYRWIFRGYKATVDWPVCEFYRELMAEFPDARVLLNVRDPGQWYDSMVETIWAIQTAFPWWFPKAYRKVHDDLLWNSRFNGEFPDRAKTIAVYEAHIAEVRHTVPPERLLVFDASEGWAPLCGFLGKPVPANVPFPHLNDRRFFQRVITALRVVEWVVPALVVASLLGLALAVF